MNDRLLAPSNMCRLTFCIDRVMIVKFSKDFFQPEPAMENSTGTEKQNSWECEKELKTDKGIPVAFQDKASAKIRF